MRPALTGKVVEHNGQICEADMDLGKLDSVIEWPQVINSTANKRKKLFQILRENLA